MHLGIHFNNETKCYTIIKKAIEILNAAKKHQSTFFILYTVDTDRNIPS